MTSASTLQQLTVRLFKLQDQAHVSSRVDTPLISYGKLLKHGWGIVPEGDGSYLVHVSGAKVPLSFKQNSLLVTGVVRMVEQVVRTIDVDIPRSWQNVKNGWYKTRDGFPICASHGRNYVDVLKTHKLDEWPYRTTLGFRDHLGWQVIKLCQSVFQLDEREAVPRRGHRCLNKQQLKIKLSMPKTIGFGACSMTMASIQTHA